MIETEEPLVILHVTAPARIGGLERVVAAMTAGHVRAGHSVHVIAVVDDAAAADHFLRPLAERGVQVHPIVVHGRAYLRERAAIRALCSAIRPTVVHTHGYRADVIAGGVARGLGIPVVTTVHGFTGGSWRNRIYETLQIWAFRRFDAVVAVSRPLAELLGRRGVPKHVLGRIVNAWSPPSEPLTRADARARLGIEESEFCLGWIGRFSREKGADVLIEALALMPSDVTASFIGDGREREALRALAVARGVDQRVRWHGVIEDAGTLLRAFDVFALSSRTEGTPMTLLEAMGANVPIVATRVGGVPDVVTASEALLVPSEDPSAIAAAVQTVRGDLVAATTRADAAKRRLAADFAIEPWLDAYVRLYREIRLRGRPRS